MSKKSTIVGPALPNIPWEEKPAGCDEPVWRYSSNPVIPRNLVPCANSIFNSAVVPFKGKFAGVFRIDDRTRASHLHVGFSDDALSWQISNEPIAWASGVKELPFEYAYDPRVVWLEDRFFVTWCNGIHGDPTIGMAWTKDFKKFHQVENITLPCNRNGVLFPRKIGGKYAMLSRPSDTGHTPFGNIYFSESPDMVYWGKHRFCMGTGGGWQRNKIGPGPAPLETREGWLLIYHGVLITCNGFIYSAGSALLDLDQPWKVIARTRPFIIAPWTQYECVGDVPNVVFPVAMLADSETGRLAIYYGCADSVTSLAFTQVDELIEFTKKNSV